MINNTCTTKNIIWEQSDQNSRKRQAQLKYPPLTIWFTGLSGSGKSTLARHLEEYFLERELSVCVLDGDNVRYGLCSDLSFSEKDRCENIRRVAEVAKILNGAGVLTITACISPIAEDRAMAQEIIGGDRFVEIYVNTPLYICEKLDVKGLYKKARSGLLPNFTGIDSPYEPPQLPDLVIDASQSSVDDCIKKIVLTIEAKAGSLNGA
ncbi:adenylyl-sulfate kinase [Pseudomonas sp. PGPPP2]|uniref:adenylyl-sulfate kinase n=1 Tax=Pseudomonas sp. PGPPP2 TaxID=2015554 RepID=UPI000BD1FA02|nr:adenylyl-sulfate kinase [Pseudomonas sp. PGPPP2]OYT81275.1 MAG: adenylyl-sulfate kinase [Pseudomonas sp. PGPPP2]